MPYTQNSGQAPKGTVMNQMLFSLPASLETYQGLGNFMFTHGLTREMYEIVDEAISAWMQGFLAAKSKLSMAISGRMSFCLTVARFATSINVSAIWRM